MRLHSLTDTSERAEGMQRRIHMRTHMLHVHIVLGLFSEPLEPTATGCSSKHTLTAEKHSQMWVFHGWNHHMMSQLTMRWRFYWFYKH